jgi:hypothetical protein
MHNLTVKFFVNSASKEESETLFEHLDFENRDSYEILNGQFMKGD